jgi:hypothetical protein
MLRYFCAIWIKNRVLAELKIVIGHRNKKASIALAFFISLLFANAFPGIVN